MDAESEATIAYLIRSVSIMMWMLVLTFKKCPIASITYHDHAEIIRVYEGTSQMIAMSIAHGKISPRNVFVGIWRRCIYGEYSVRVCPRCHP